jgi:GNAT superfamily N-acetyltransferase
MATDATIRPMREDDLAAAERLSDEVFHDLDSRTHPRELPVPGRRTPERSAAWQVRTAHILAGDPGGCWVAEDGRGMLGFATSYNRELTWVLATYVVRSDAQGLGLGKALLAAAMHHGRGCLRGMLSASVDPAAVRRYRLAGFSLHPQMLLTGTLDRSALPVVEKVREGTAGDVELMDSVDRRARGSAHGRDHEALLREFRVVVSDSSTGSGYAYLNGQGTVQLLAATNRRTATRLLWEALASTQGDEASVHHVTAANEWALDVGFAVRLSPYPAGYLALRGMRPPVPYLHHGVFL